MRPGSPSPPGGPGCFVNPGTPPSSPPSGPSFPGNPALLTVTLALTLALTFLGDTFIFTPIDIIFQNLYKNNNIFKLYYIYLS